MQPPHVAVSLLRDDRLMLADRHGMPARAFELEDLAPLANLPAGKRPVILAHGFRYDPDVDDDDNPHRSTFVHWCRDLAPDRPVLAFGWWSCPGGAFSPLRHLTSLWAAWKHGRWNTYRLCWDRAAVAGDKLGWLAGHLPPSDVLCHSAGSRVVLRAIRTTPALPWANVVLMNGAEHRPAAIEAAQANPHTRFRNLCVAEDDVLRYFGATFSPGRVYSPCIGLKGLGTEPNAGMPADWRDIPLGHPDTKAWAAAKGWPDVRGDNPREPWDHWYSHKHPGNWPLIRAALAGEV